MYIIYPGATLQVYAVLRCQCTSCARRLSNGIGILTYIRQFPPGGRSYSSRRQSQHELHVLLPVAAMLLTPAVICDGPCKGRGDWARTRWPRYALNALYIKFVPWFANLNRLVHHTLFIGDPHGADAEMVPPSAHIARTTMAHSDSCALFIYAGRGRRLDGFTIALGQASGGTWYTNILALQLVLFPVCNSYQGVRTLRANAQKYLQTC